MQRRSRRSHRRLRATVLSLLLAALVGSAASAGSLATPRTDRGFQSVITEDQKPAVDGEVPEDADGSDVVPLELDHEAVVDHGICPRVDPPVTKTGTAYRC
jgi:hypothetical protein